MLGKDLQKQPGAGALVPVALICSGVQSHSPGGEWSWQLSSRTRPWSPLITVVKEESCGAYSSGINSVG